MKISKRNQIEKLLIEKCSLIFHSYFNRDMDTFIQMLDQDFVWIGSYEFQFAQGINEFLKITKEEQNELSAEVYDEEYHILSHEQNIWIVYGRFCASAWKDETTFLYTRQRATYVWKYTEGKFKLLHLHCTMARDVPLEGAITVDAAKKTNTRWYDYMLYAENLRSEKDTHFLLKDEQGGLHYLLPNEILYVSISYRVATVYTSTGSFCVRKNLVQLQELMPFLLQTHKSWLVHPLYITKIKRYAVTLVNGIEIPVGKPRYNEVCQHLTQRERNT